MALSWRAIAWLLACAVVVTMSSSSPHGRDLRAPLRPPSAWARDAEAAAAAAVKDSRGRNVTALVRLASLLQARGAYAEARDAAAAAAKLDGGNYRALDALATAAAALGDMEVRALLCVCVCCVLCLCLGF
jgi:hypothetical protein